MDWNNDYTHAGPGFKRRVRRESLDQSAKSTSRPRAKNRKASHIETSEPHRSARSVKNRIRHLVLDHDMSYSDACETMKRHGYSITGVTVSNIRAEMKEILHMLLDIGLIDRDDLARYRRQFTKKQARGRDE